MTPNHNPHVVPGVDLDALEAKAEAASKGERVVIVDPDGDFLIRLDTWELGLFWGEHEQPNADLAAACDPDTVLELIRLARKGRDDMRVVAEALFWLVGHLEGLHFPVNDRPFIQNALRVANPTAAASLESQVAASPSPVEGPTE